MTRDELDAILLIYATGCGDPEECARAEALLNLGNPQVQAAYAEALMVVHSIPHCLDPIAPPPGLRDRVLTRVAAEQSARTHVRHGVPAWASFTAMALAACLAVALTVSFIADQRAHERTRVLAADLTHVKAKLGDAQHQLQTSHTTLASLQTTLAKTNTRLTSTLATLNDARSVLQAPKATLASLNTTDKSGTKDAGYGRVLYSPQTGQYEVLVFDLKPLPPGKVYELWLITPDQKKLPAGTFAVDQHGAATLLATAPKGTEVALAAITDEPMGGSPQPTGSIRLASETLIGQQ